MKIHIVKKGDTLFELSKKYNVPLEKLIEANPQIANPNQLNIGDKVKIPAVAVPIGGETGNVYKHIVKQGDTLWKLSKAWGLPLQSLIDANPQLSDPNQLKVGDIVNIPTGAGNPWGEVDNPSAPNVGMSPVQTGKKNTAPIAGSGKKAPTGTKPEMTAPKPEKVEPVKTEKPKEAPKKTEPSKQEPINVEPPKQQPINVAPPKQQPINVAPPKQQPAQVQPPKVVPMEIKMEVEQIQYESTKLQPIHFEPQKHEPVKIQPYSYEPNISPANYGPQNVSPYSHVPMKGEPTGVSPYGYEPMKGEPTGVSPYGYGPMKGEPTGVSPYSHVPMKGEPTGVSPYGYEPMKGEPTGVSPYGYEPMKGEPKGISPYGYEPMKGEPTGVSPYTYGPNTQPNQYPNLSYPSHLLPQYTQPSTLPAMGYAPSPCGCSGTSPYPYTTQTQEAYPPFYQYPIAAEPVSGYYGNPSPTALSPTEGEYPGILNANAPVSQMPNLGAVSPYANPNPNIQPHAVFPQAVSPEANNNAFYPQTMDWGHHPGMMPCYGPPVPGYPTSVMPSAYSYPMAYPGANNLAPLANEPLKGEVGGMENMKGHFDREAQTSASGDETEESEPQKTEANFKTPTSSKKNVKISGSPDSQPSSKKQSKSSNGSTGKKNRQRTGSSIGRRNPWINA
ncbi:LysM peptidoglycan-binding domain-containing protein [Paenibacillus sp. MB22_1]|uniref:LysM peptidoglycan-binding domain-containing protein n=1 Tax=Paenibacillus sp. MB22_1 TaxID=3383121 RepID=UPI0039A30620